ncbi:COP1-interactive protein 1-like [Argonauta hians]
MDDYNNLKKEYDQLVTETEKLQNQREELKLLKTENTSLRNENSEVYEELNKLKEMKYQVKTVQLDRDKYLEELQLEQRRNFSLQQDFEHVQKELHETVRDKKILEDNFLKMSDKYKQLKVSREEETTLPQRENHPGESMKVITDMIMTELKSELEMMKSTWISPDAYEHLKKDLSIVRAERDSFECECQKLCKNSMDLKNTQDLLMEKMKLNHENAQKIILEKQQTIELLKEDLKTFHLGGKNWQQIESKYKSEIQQNLTEIEYTSPMFNDEIIQPSIGNISSESSELCVSKSQQKENSSHQNDLMKPFKELLNSKNVLDKLELTSINSKEVVTSSNSKLEFIQQSPYEEKSHANSSFDDLTGIFTLQVKERHTETHEEVNVKSSGRDKRICLLSNILTEKSSLVEKYGNSNNELIQIISNLKQKISERERQIVCLEKELDEKCIIIKEKDIKLDEFNYVVENMKMKISEMSEKHQLTVVSLEEKQNECQVVQAKLSQQEKELNLKNSECNLVVAAGDHTKKLLKSYKDQISEAENKIDSQNKQMKHLQEEMAEMKVKAKQEFNEMKRQLTQDLSVKDEELKASRQEVTKMQSDLEKEMTRCKFMEENIKVPESNCTKMVSAAIEEDEQLRRKERDNCNKSQVENSQEKQAAAAAARDGEKAVTDQLISQLKTDLSEIKTTWVTPDVHKQLKKDFLNVTSERDMLQSKCLKLHEDTQNVPSKVDTEKNGMEIIEMDENILDSKHSTDKQKPVPLATCLKTSNWCSTEVKCKSETCLNQASGDQIKSPQTCEEIFYARKSTDLIEVSKNANDLGTEKTCRFDEVSCEHRYFHNQIIYQSEHLEEMKQSFENQLKASAESYETLKNQFEDMISEHKEMQVKLGEQEKEIERHVTVNQLLEKTKITSENKFGSIEIVKSQPEGTNTLKNYSNQIERFNNEKEKVVDQLEQETDNFNDVVKNLKCKLLTLELNAADQQTNLKAAFDELAKKYSVLSKETCLEPFNHMEQLNMQLSEKDSCIYLLSNDLKEKSLLLEKYKNSNKELGEMILNLKQNISKKETETDLLKVGPEEKPGTIQEKDKKLDGLISIVEDIQKSISDISQRNNSSIGVLEEKHKDFICAQAKLIQKEEELEKQQREFESVFNSSNNINKQHKILIKTSSQNLVSRLSNAVESQNRLIKSFQEQIPELRLKIEKEFNKENCGEDAMECSMQQETIQHRSSDKEEITNSRKTPEELLKMLEEKYQRGARVNNIPMEGSKLKPEDVQKKRIDPVIHEKLIDLSDVISERDFLESQLLQICEESLILQSKNKFLLSEMEKMKIEQGDLQKIILDKQQIIQRLKEDLKSFPQIETTHTTNAQQRQLKTPEIQCTLPNSVEKDIYATKSNIGNIDVGRVKSSLEVHINEQIEMLYREKGKAIEKLKLETMNFNKVVSHLKEKLEVVKEDVTERETILKNEFEEITKCHAMLSVKNCMGLIDQMEGIHTQVCEKDSKICELSNALTEKFSLIEEYLNLNNKLSGVINSLKLNICDRKTEISLLKRKLEERSNIIQEKDAELRELTSIDAEQKNILELFRRHLCEIENLQQKLKEEYVEKISSITNEYELKIKEDYISKSVVKLHGKETSKELESSMETPYEECNDKCDCLINQHTKKFKFVADELNTSHGYVDCNNRPNMQKFFKIIQKLKEYESRIKLLDEKHLDTLQRVRVELKKNISQNYISKEVFGSKLSEETIMYLQLEERFKEKEEKLQTIFKEYEHKLSEITQNYENKIATQMTLKSERENLTTEPDVQKSLYKDELEVLDEASFIPNKICRENISSNHAEEYDIENAPSKNIKEVSKQLFKLTLFDRDIAMETYQKRVAEVYNKMEKQIECLQEEIKEITENAVHEYNELKKELTQCLKEKDEEMENLKQEMTKLKNTYDNETTKCKSMEEQIKVFEDVNGKVKSSLKDIFQTEINQMKENFEKELSNKESSHQTEIKIMNESHCLELTSSKTKWKDLHQKQCDKLSDYELIIREKDQEVATLNKQLETGKEAMAELERRLAINRIKSLKEELSMTSHDKQEVVAKLHDYKVFYILLTTLLCSFLVVPIYS